MRAPEPGSVVVETPERVALSLEVAGLGYRVLAFLIDGAILFLFWIAFVYLLGVVRPFFFRDFLNLPAFFRGLGISGMVVVNWAYDISFETLWNGQTPGKRALGLRVVKEDGSPVGFFESAARNVCRLVDFLPVFYGIGVVSMLASARSRRLGDFVAGSLVIRERGIDLSRYDSKSWAGTARHSLTAEEFELVTRFLTRAPGLAPAARDKLARQLAEQFAARLPESERVEILSSPESSEAFLRRAAGYGERDA